MEAPELGRWTRFAEKGGIGKCTAVQDCVAEASDDLMFLKDDDITVLMQLSDHEDLYLGYCEGVVGRFNGADVCFHSKLKKPVMAKRSSAVSAKTLSPSPGVDSHASYLATNLGRSSSDIGSLHQSASRSPAREISSIEPVISQSPTVPSSLSSSSEFNIPPLSSCISTSTDSDSILATPHRFSSGYVNQPLNIDGVNEARHSLDDDYAPLVRVRTESPVVDATKLDAESRRLRSSVPPTLADSILSSLQSPVEQTTDLSESNGRMSATLSDGEVGIGLSLLQDLANEMDEWSSTSSSRNSQSQDPNGAHITHSSSSDNGPLSQSSMEPSRPYSRSPSRDLSSPTSDRRSHSDLSNDWDIYDDYRYSRQSMASRISRLSQMSAQAPHPNSQVPPLPTEFRRSEDRKSSTDSEHPLSIRTSKFADHPRAEAGDRRHKDTPSALDLASTAFTGAGQAHVVDPEPSPLIGATFASPSTSPGRSSTLSTSPLGPTPSSFMSITTEMTSALRYTSEIERSSPNVVAISTQQRATEESWQGRTTVVGENQGDLRPQQATADIEQEPITNMLPAHSRAPLESIKNSSSPPVSRPKSPPSSEPIASNGLSSSSTISAPRNISHPTQMQASLHHTPSVSEIQQLPDSQPTRLFLPHPNAPKPTTSSSGPLYARRALMNPSSIPPSIPDGSVIHVLRKAISGSRGASGPMTFYGKCDQDLAKSKGPVPISFSVDAPPVVATERNVTNTPKRPAVAPSSSASMTDVVVPSRNVIPRAHFSPKAPSSRPRSRSFSGFDTAAAEVVNKLPFKQLEGHSHKSSQSAESVARSESTPSPLSQKLNGSSKPSATVRASHTPSPLSLPENSIVAGPPFGRSATTSLSPSPLGPSSARLTLSAVPPDRLPPPSKLRQVKSSANLNESSTPTHLPPLQNPSNVRSPPLSSSYSQPGGVGILPALGDSRGITPSQPSGLRARRSVDVVLNRSSSQAVSPTPLVRSASPTTPRPLSRNNSLRTKLSLPNLRGRNAPKNRQDDASSITSGPHANEFGMDNETVQVKDTDFELIRPNIPQLSSPTSDDSLSISRSGSLDAWLDVTNGRLRSDSPAVSMRSVSQQSISDSSWQTSSRTSESESSMDAHRQRELKWMSLMSSIPPAQSRTSKKIKKLLQDGVPSSVRFLVWTHLTDSKARGMPRVYSQLVQRGQAAVSSEVERDIQMCIADQPRLQSAQSSLLCLLQAYFTMVPDIQYHRGLTYIVGHLLLLSPEEDAFWIFVAMMDTHLRPYFSHNDIQVEVDASLFSKALESNDPPLSRKILFDLGVNPTSICRPWFSCVFSGSLPLDYLHRVWDYFLCEGITFLFRVGLALLCCCRRQLLRLSSEETLLRHLLRPPPICLPPTADAFISLVHSVKLKDGDIRKQRVKMEAQLKRQTQSRSISVPALPPSISLPRG